MRLDFIRTRVCDNYSGSIGLETSDRELKASREGSKSQSDKKGSISNLQFDHRRGGDALGGFEGVWRALPSVRLPGVRLPCVRFPGVKVRRRAAVRSVDATPGVKRRVSRLCERRFQLGLHAKKNQIQPGQFTRENRRIQPARPTRDNHRIQPTRPTRCFCA